MTGEAKRHTFHQQLPKYQFEPGFQEEDPLWDPNFRETNATTDKRMKKLLDDIFDHDSSSFISFTSHSGAIASILGSSVIGNFGLSPDRPFLY